jgi:hypothetical protein
VLSFSYQFTADVASGELEMVVLPPEFTDGNVDKKMETRVEVPNSNIQHPEKVQAPTIKCA